MLTDLNQYKNSFKHYTELRVQENRSFRIGLLNVNPDINNIQFNNLNSDDVKSRNFKRG